MEYVVGVAEPGGRGDIPGPSGCAVNDELRSDAEGNGSSFATRLDDEMLPLRTEDDPVR
jgi:hypothetical protein